MHENLPDFWQNVYILLKIEETKNEQIASDKKNDLLLFRYPPGGDALEARLHFLRSMV